MPWRKSPPELIALFDSVVPHKPGVVAKPMFGYPACFVNGHMFMGLHQENMIVRLSEEDRAEALKVDGSKIFEPMPGRAMNEYVSLAPTVLQNKDGVRAWAARALAYAGALPSKTAKKNASKKSGSARG